MGENTINNNTLVSPRAQDGGGHIKCRHFGNSESARPGGDTINGDSVVTPRAQDRGTMINSNALVTPVAHCSMRIGPPGVDGHSRAARTKSIKT